MYQEAMNPFKYLYHCFSQSTELQMEWMEVCYYGYRYKINEHFIFHTNICLKNISFLQIFMSFLTSKTIFPVIYDINSWTCIDLKQCYKIIFFLNLNGGMFAMVIKFTKPFFSTLISVSKVAMPFLTSKTIFSCHRRDNKYDINSCTCIEFKQCYKIDFLIINCLQHQTIFLVIGKTINMI